MILEGIVTTVGPDGAVNIAPMGPIVDPAMQHIILRPFPASQTYRNLKLHPEGVLHVTDDVLLLAQAAVGLVEPPPPVRPAQKIRGFVLENACRHHEFRVVSVDASEPRVRIEADVIFTGRQRDFFGFNRAKHSVVEAAILATRTHLLPQAEVDNAYRKLSIVVEKTGGAQEKAAMAYLSAYVAGQYQRGGDR
jgi:uncharacterized protein